MVQCSSPNVQMSASFHILTFRYMDNNGHLLFFSPSFPIGLRGWAAAIKLLPDAELSW